MGRSRRAASRAGRRRPACTGGPEGRGDAREPRGDARQARLRRYPDVPFTILAAPGEVQLQFAARGTPEEAPRVLDRIEADFHKALAGEIFGRDDETLEGVVGDLLRLKQRTLALAESCTGGLLAGRSRTSRDRPTTSSAGGHVRERREGGPRRRLRRQRSSASARSPRRPRARWRSARASGSARRSASRSRASRAPAAARRRSPSARFTSRSTPADGTRLHRRLLLPGERSLIRRWTTSDRARDAAQAPSRPAAGTPVTRELLSLVAAYLLGSISFAIVLVRVFRGVDVRPRARAMPAPRTSSARRGRGSRP